MFEIIAFGVVKKNLEIVWGGVIVLLVHISSDEELFQCSLLFLLFSDYKFKKR